MRITRSFIRPILLTYLIFISATNVFALPRTGQPAPTFKVVTTAGLPATLDNYRGHVLILDFFATWCQPCRLSIPHLVDINKKYGKQGLQILGLSADENGERSLSTFMSEQTINYPVALAPDNLLSDYGVRAVPVMYVIDKKGKVAEIYRGYNHEIGRASEQLIKKLLAEK